MYVVTNGLRCTERRADAWTRKSKSLCNDTIVRMQVNSMPAPHKLHIL